MYLLKGFITSSNLYNNVEGQVATFGELSKNALTYSIETGVYKLPAYANLHLHTFRSEDDVTGLIEPSATYVNDVLEISHFIYDLSNTSTLTDNKAIVLQNLENTYRDVLENISCGDMVTDGVNWMPEWIAFSFVGKDDYIRLWYADQPFLLQYDDYEYRIVPPIDNLDIFFEPAEVVQNYIQNSSTKNTIDNIILAKQDNPFTVINSTNYDWYDPTNPLNTIITNWNVLVYGLYGNSTDKVRIGIQDYILANSTHTKEEWLELFPDIFTPVEFIITPIWHRYAIANQSIQDGFLSPVITLGEARSIALLTCKGLGYESNFLLDNTTVTTSSYKTLAFLATGSQVNRTGISKFNEQLPDYIDISTRSSDFARMSLYTQEWVRRFNKLLMIAETMDDYTIVPAGFSRVYRDNIMYATMDYENVQYLVVTRKSLITLLGITDIYYPEFINV